MSLTLRVVQCSQSVLNANTWSIPAQRPEPCDMIVTATVYRAVDYVQILPAEPIAVCATHSARLRESGHAVSPWHAPYQRDYSEALSTL